MMKLKLSKPICFFDLEATGVDPVKDRIVSISIIKIFPSGKKEEFYTIMNPSVSVPEGASKIHGITDEIVKDEPYFENYADKILSYFNGSDIAGFNCNNYDIPLLSAEFERAQIAFPEVNAKFLDVSNIYRKLNPRTLSAAVYQYLGKSLDNAHNAHADNQATLDVMESILEKHPDLPDTVDALSFISDYDKKKVDLMGKFILGDNGRYVYNFGKHKGSVICYSNVEYLGWILNNDFHPNTKEWARKIYNEIMNVSAIDNEVMDDLPF
jgi:DNA polymerase-3 subunit epsilon